MKRSRTYKKITVLFFITMLTSFTSNGQPITKKLVESHSSQIQEGTVPKVNPRFKNITSNSINFTDAANRNLFLRGINLGGSSKVPFKPNGATHIPDGFFNGKDISFVGRPFPLNEADSHFLRLKAWGFHFIRLNITWEAIEHEGPGIYDTNYLEYLKALISKAAEYDINVLIDPHQDVWSRFSGGDGAPLWTFEVAGMDITKFSQTASAIVHYTFGDPFPKMIWYTNYYKHASASMFTLFFGGNDFAPLTNVDGTPIQDYLQNHYIKAIVKVAETLKDLPNIIGFEVMNEPSAGYIGVKDLSQPFGNEIIGDAPTPWQGMILAEGFPQEIERFYLGFSSIKKEKTSTLNKEKISVWKDNKPGVWRQNGVWDISPEGSPILIHSDYFSKVKNTNVDFNSMYYIPFIERFADAISKIDTNWLICVDNILSPHPLKIPELKNLKGFKWLNGSHWYDDVTLVKKTYMPFLGLYNRKVVFGKANVMKAYEKTLSEMIEDTRKFYGDAPTLLGEFGIPFDLNKAKAYKTGNFNIQSKAIDRSFKVAEKNLLNYTLWNYTADNTNERGDQWNGEDLSIFSISQQYDSSDINSGGRALDAVVRPYPRKITGTLKEYSYKYKNKELFIKFNVEKLSEYPNEIFVPEYIYKNNFVVSSTEPTLAFDKKERTLLYYPSKTGEHIIIVKSK